MKITNVKDCLIEKTTEKTAVRFRDAQTGESYTSELLLAYHGWPTAVQDESGVIYVAASANRLDHVDPFGETCLYVCRDLKTGRWEKRVVNHSVENGAFVDHRDTGLLYLGNGRMVLTHFTHNSDIYTNGKEELWVGWKRKVNEADPRNADAIVQVWKNRPWFNGSYVQYSNDYGKTWSVPQKVAVSSPHGPALLRDGTLYYAGRYGSQICAQRATVSYDSEGNITGIRWSGMEPILDAQAYCTPNEEIVLCEPHAVQLTSGRLLVAIRVQNVLNGKQQHSDLCYTGFCVWVCNSDDNGKTWKILDHTRLAGSPPHLLELKPNVVLMTCAKRGNGAPDHPRVCGEFGYLSDDGGETWREPFPISIGPNGDCGYPATVLRAQEQGQERYHLTTVYYQNDKTTTNLLYTDWDLEL